MWSYATAAARNINYGLPPELFFIAPAPSFQNHHPDAAPTTTINFDPHSIGVIPLLTATPRLRVGDEEGLKNARIRAVSSAGVGSMHLWQYPQLGNNSPVNYLKKPMINNNNNNNTDHLYLLQSGGNITGDSSSTGTTTCQDCGNQAKKGCSHQRCRTCCKNRGFDCTTHVKSTWVPATRRRERQLMGTNTAGSSQSTSSAKKPRLGPPSQTTSHTSTSNNANTPSSFDATSSHQDAGFRDPLPGQVSAPAVFKCVRVTAVDDDWEGEYAYQAVVRIGGHVFKGFLYDQGFDQAAKDNVLFPNVSDLHLGGGCSGDGRNGAPYSHQLPDSSHDFYEAVV